MEDDGAGFDFFLSYSRADRAVARKVVRALRRIAMPWHRRSRRRIFRDEDVLVPGRRLEDAIKDGLRRSRVLVVLLSPATRRRGDWVTREVTWWHEMDKPLDQLIFVVVEGTFQDGIPLELAGRPTIEGRLHVNISQQVADRRTSLRHRAFLDAMSGVVAALDPRRDKDAVFNEERRQHRRMLRSAAAAGTVAVVVLAGLGGVAARQHFLALKQRSDAQRSQAAAADANRRRHAALVQKTAGGLTEDAERLADSDPQHALQLALAAVALQQNPTTMGRLTDVLVKDHRTAGGNAGVGQVNDLALSPDGRQILVAGDAGRASLWSVTPVSTRPGPVLFEGAGEIDTQAVALPTPGLAVVGVRTVADVFDTTSSPPRKIAELPGSRNLISVIRASADGRTVVVVNIDGAAQIWNLSRPDRPVLRTTVQTHIGPGVAALSSDGSLLAVGFDLNHEVQLFDLRQPRPAPLVLPRSFSKPASAVAFSTDGTELAAAGSDGRVQLWDTRRPAVPRLIRQWSPGLQRSLAFSPDGHRLAGGDQGGRLTLWNLANPGDPSRLARLALHAGAVSAVCFAPDGRTLWTAGKDGSFFSVRLDHLPEPAKTGVLHDADADVFAAALQPNGATLVTGGNALPAERWGVGGPAAQRQADLPVPRDQISTLAWNADGSRLALGDGRDVILADAAGSVLSMFQAESGLVSFVAVTLDGDYLVTGGNSNLVRIWRPNGTPVATVASHAEVLALSRTGLLAFTPDTRHVDLVNVHDPAHPSLVGRSADFQDGGIRAAAFNSAGTVLATVGEDRQAVLWDVSHPSRPEKIQELTPAFDDTADGVAFSADGRLLAVGSFDNSVRIWDVADPRNTLAVATLADHTDYVMGVTTDEAGRLATVGRDGRIMLYDITALDRDVTDPVAQACAVAGGGLNPRAWAAAIPAEIPWIQTCP